MSLEFTQKTYAALGPLVLNYGYEEWTHIFSQNTSWFLAPSLPMDWASDNHLQTTGWGPHVNVGL